MYREMLYTHLISVINCLCTFHFKFASYLMQGIEVTTSITFYTNINFLSLFRSTFAGCKMLFNLTEKVEAPTGVTFYTYPFCLLLFNLLKTSAKKFKYLLIGWQYNVSTQLSSKLCPCTSVDVSSECKAV